MPGARVFEPGSSGDILGMLPASLDIFLNPEDTKSPAADCLLVALRKFFEILTLKKHAKFRELLITPDAPRTEDSDLDFDNESDGSFCHLEPENCKESENEAGSASESESDSLCSGFDSEPSPRPKRRREK